MSILKGKITSAKEHGGHVWLHLSKWGAGSGWISISKIVFDNVFRDKIVKKVYAKYNRNVVRKIKKLQRQIKLLKKEKEKEYAIRDRENQIHALRSTIKKDLHMHDIVGKKIDLRIL